VPDDFRVETVEKVAIAVGEAHDGGGGGATSALATITLKLGNRGTAFNVPHDPAVSRDLAEAPCVAGALDFHADPTCPTCGADARVSSLISSTPRRWPPLRPATRAAREGGAASDVPVGRAGRGGEGGTRPRRDATRVKCGKCGRASPSRRIPPGATARPRSSLGSCRLSNPPEKLKTCSTPRRIRLRSGRRAVEGRGVPAPATVRTVKTLRSRRRSGWVGRGVG
jgi:hypothetical protein